VSSDVVRGFSRIFLLGILILKRSLRDVFISLHKFTCISLDFQLDINRVMFDHVFYIYIFTLMNLWILKGTLV
jgi:hypothetical protein